MKLKRPRINRICSSKDYKHSREQYKEYLHINHERNVEIIQKITSEIVITPKSIDITIHKKPYVKCFGKLMPITIEDAERLSKTPDIVILWQ